MKAKINANGREITVLSNMNKDDNISLTDIAKYKNKDDPRFVIQNWMRTRFTVEFLGIWEQLNNSSFNSVEFEAVKNETGTAEVWFARDLQLALDYAAWDKFKLVIHKAINSYENSGQNPNDHFFQVGKMVELGSGSQREIEELKKFNKRGERKLEKDEE